MESSSGLTVRITKIKAHGALHSAKATQKAATFMQFQIK